jgi:metal-responsive CopG/Arc/MetJ family transcriptional regulator
MAVEKKTSLVVNIRLDQETVAEVDAVAVEEGRTRSNMLARLIRAALDAHGRRRNKKKKSIT